MRRHHHRRSVNTAASSVCGYGLDHYIQMTFPIIRHIVADQNLATSRSMHLDIGVARVFLNSRVTPKYDTTSAGKQNRIAAIVRRWIKAKSLLRESRRDHRLDDTIRRQWILATWLKKDGRLHNQRRQPKRINSRRIAGQGHTQAIGDRIEIYIDVAQASTSLIKKLRRQTAR